MWLYLTILSTSLLLFSTNLTASGQRSMDITAETLSEYRSITLHSPPHNHLHYAGTSDGQHLLMITLTSVDQNSNGRPMMPFDSTYAYTLSSDELEIENGWDISEQLKTGGITISPRDCPTIPLSPQQTRISLPNDPALMPRCISVLH